MFYVSYRIHLVLFMLGLSEAVQISNVVRLACQRKPSLKICSTNIATSAVNVFGEDDKLPKLPRQSSVSQLIPHKQYLVNLTRSEILLLRQFDTETRQFRNPFHDPDNVRLNEDLVQFEDDDRLSHRLVTEEEDNLNNDDNEKSNESLTSDSFDPVTAYCDRYRENYVYYCTDSINRTPVLNNHLKQFCPSYESNCPSQAHKASSLALFPVAVPPVPETSPDFPDVFNPLEASIKSEADAKLASLKKRFPCTPKCDPKVHKHCTAECKCDYIYPTVQRFCNPPPIPFFLNTCRLWYHGCPKYSQYNYASQFVYSAAEKGKTVGGDAAKNTLHRGTGASALVPPSSPLAKGEHTRVINPEKAVELTSVQTIKRPSDPFKSITTPAGKTPTIRPRAHQASSAVVDDTSFHKFDKFTNSQGVALRTRSRSPFSKPGLWSANPDNPHNRDHANKWWYNPESVTADWLSGQLAWGAHWAVPAAGVGGTDGFSAVHFPTIGNFLNIADDYD